WPQSPHFVRQRLGFLQDRADLIVISGPVEAPCSLVLDPGPGRVRPEEQAAEPEVRLGVVGVDRDRLRQKITRQVLIGGLWRAAACLERGSRSAPRCPAPGCGGGSRARAGGTPPPTEAAAPDPWRARAGSTPPWPPRSARSAACGEAEPEPR